MATEPTLCTSCGHRTGQQATTTIQVSVRSGVDSRELGKAIRRTMLALRRRGGLGS